MNFNPHDANRKPTNRISKLKRRKRKTSPTNFPTNPLAKFAANAPGNSTSSDHRDHVSSTVNSNDDTRNSTAALMFNDTASSASTGTIVGLDHRHGLQSTLAGVRSPVQTDQMRIQMTPPSASEILKLKNETFSLKTISAEIDFFITSSCLNFESFESDSSSSRTPGSKRKRREIQHPILGSILLNPIENVHQNDAVQRTQRCCFQDGDGRINPYHVCKLAFPPCQAEVPYGNPNADANANAQIGARNTNAHDLYYRGDGAIVSNGNLAISEPSREASLSKASEIYTDVKWVKILSEHGATIRGHYDIGKETEYIGKLPFGSVRMCVKSKRLQPPADSDGENEEEPRLVVVMRYKIRLLPCDVLAKKDDGDSTEGGCEEGWISDMSRLYDDPYVIAELLEY